MRIKQGGYRSKPDGYLHLNNFSHTRASGLAGVIFERILTERQQEIVEKTLIDRAAPKSLLGHAGDHGEQVIFKHDCYRFKKEFLNDNFKGVVYGCLRLFRRSAAQLLSMAVVGEELETSHISVGFPKNQ